MNGVPVEFDPTLSWAGKAVGESKKPSEGESPWLEVYVPTCYLSSPLYRTSTNTTQLLCECESSSLAGLSPQANQ